MQLRSVTPLVFSANSSSVIVHRDHCTIAGFITMPDVTKWSTAFYSFPLFLILPSRRKKKKGKVKLLERDFSKALSVFLSHHPQNLMIKLLLISMAAVMLIPTTPGHAMLKCICDMCFLFSWSYLAPIDSFLLSLCFPVFWFSSQ